MGGSVSTEGRTLRESFKKAASVVVSSSRPRSWCTPRSISPLNSLKRALHSFASVRLAASLYRIKRYKQSLKWKASYDMFISTGPPLPWSPASCAATAATANPKYFLVPRAVS